jgi:sec-independent protein translocase protein TatC
MPSSNASMSLIEHLQELRKHLVRSAVGVTLTSGIAFIFWRDIWYWVAYPLQNTKVPVTLINTSPTEGFVTSIKVALVAGLLLGCPWIFWNLWRFISPGLLQKERQTVFPLMFASSLLFLAGIGFSYFTVLPYGLDYLASYTLGEINPNWRQGDYASFVLKVLLAFGIAFQLPVMSYVGTKAKWFTARGLWKGIRYALVIIFITSAFLTPPDPSTQVLLAVPLTVIYLLSIGVSWLAKPKITQDLEEREKDS